MSKRLERLKQLSTLPDNEELEKLLGKAEEIRVREIIAEQKRKSDQRVKKSLWDNFWKRKY